jgi:crotonobetaine/carnitine-CoA ligase
MSALPELRDRTLTRAFERVLKHQPDKVAQSDGTDSYTYAEAHERALTLAGGVAQLGVGRQETVALMLDNHLDIVHLWFGLNLTGGIEVPVNTAYKGSFLAHILNDSGARILVIEDRYCERVALIADELRHLETVVVRGGTGEALAGSSFARVPFDQLFSSNAASPIDVTPDELMMIMYTSGTTGLSKGVLIPHAHGYTYSSREDAERPTSTDRLLCVLPMFHLAGQGFGIYQPLIAGAFSFLTSGFSLGAFWDTVRRERITVTTLVGAMAELLQQAASLPDDADNPLEIAMMAPLASNLDGFRERFGVGVVAVYGSSEVGCPMASEPADVVAAEAGMARQGYDLRLVDQDGEDVPDGQIGELLVRPHVPHTILEGYCNLPETTAEYLRDGWAHTGDAFRRVDGHYFFADRLKDALRRRGENISSFEVERIVNQHPDVYESAVVAVPSELAEDEVKAVIVLRDGVEPDPEGIIRFLIDRMAYFMVPRYLEFVAELPKTPTAKIQKILLRETGAAAAWDREAAGIAVTRNS